MIKVESVYPITIKKFPDGSEVVYITGKDIKQYTQPVKLDSLNNFMSGQTVYIEGYYPSDVERWLNGMGNND